MKILAIIGSPRTNGNTYRAVNQIERELNKKNEEIEFEYVQLNRISLELCKGCYVCIAKGEDKCPLKDDRESLEIKMKQADAVIFASPVYTYNVSWIMKNFLDRFAYRCHRPEFHGKKAMVVVTTGAVGIRFVTLILSFMLGAMGFITCAKAGITFAPPHETDEKKSKKETNKLIRQTEVFYKNLIDAKPVKPSFVKLLTFKMQQKAFSKAPQNLADFKYWRDKGWLEKTEDYYYKVPVRKVNKIIVSLISKLKV
ncbi:flavodoxin family protein [Anaerocolumna xylanovorans]|uniref:NADPH-dependent FMN reductase n=1 Tax=Anaerocolumna xylanovorans DSM 12503 TaxID=1121345 RepID=A0A1M7YI89_9FIRM|nr:flavodoxin family protein [Anaerocolumna xylanovorans]SHO52342.1 NADPH-dependent FMN reductase [Anaerocolumna xylanovorans DSM 12503]